MATKQVTLVHVNDEYIDMELSSSPNFFSYSLSSPPSNREFEFQMSEKESSTSPADDLFYKGKLLPLHLPPRLQMVQNLIDNSNAKLEHTTFPFTTQSNISPSESRRVSSDVTPNEFQVGWFSDMNNLIGDLPKKSWPKKLKQMKQFWLGQRLKASRAYLKTLFNKSGCSDKFCASAAASNMGGAEKISRCKECQSKYMKVAWRNPFESFYDNKDQVTCDVMKTIKREMLQVEDDFHDHRRSFSGVGQRHCATKASSLSTSSSGSSSSSSSFSFSSAGYYDLQLFKRSISANYDLECSIEGAIAHCKQSQQQCGSKNGSGDSRICSQFATKMQLVGVNE
ncbi:putative membrane-associated kinase regulator 4, partial [Mucuna pruriens]